MIESPENLITGDTVYGGRPAVRGVVGAFFDGSITIEWRNGSEDTLSLDSPLWLSLNVFDGIPLHAASHPVAPWWQRPVLWVRGLWFRRPWNPAIEQTEIELHEHSRVLSFEEWRQDRESRNGQ